ncbi:quinone-dependent dihydroorotate dehydrogenase [Sphingobacterium sp. DK4209]|uniref:Dihydroorotate dehydrogenase (quinone) n=1 Tax=Sphingobacterium zhuxiongii TaxID=2662364 RepID=A0A5Q0Q9P5_9SPHI|nr:MULTISPECIES: quinone-dependent dihydroorotate dehydrogenase [unclassified Sphingobacterium]MVZ66750.1 quinone-dependent dihydroorotate dehydrogenase [Sphingobacterium sp. DK4209]QGA26263.1 quinone-dependent dihydroorotate dehydrogenase [Sphingobacterium sp. dk4302]
MYKLVKPLFFQMNPEQAHNNVTSGLKVFTKIWGSNAILKSLYAVEDPRLQTTVFGLTFKNPVGLAAGFDKNADYIEQMSKLGFGFIEIGTVTPKPQPGNDKPRMFRLVNDEALINRMGFNNQGADVAAGRLKHLKEKNGVIIGGNIGKNKVTPNEEAVNDYIYCFNSLFDYVDYFVVNVSSPNTPGLRDLQEKEPLKHILNTLQELNMAKASPKPILLKIAPDLTDSQLDDIVEIVQDTKIAGVIATNTTISREGLKSDPNLVKETGGVSGKPLTKRSTEVIKYLSDKSNKAFPIIGVGGIHSAADAIEKLNAGASLVQVYTGFIYQGPGLVAEICKGILKGK